MAPAEAVTNPVPSAEGVKEVIHVSRSWIVSPAMPDHALALARRLGISPVTAAILVARGATGPEEAQRWLDAASGPRHDPFLLPDMEVAVDRVRRAIQSRESVCFYGDYDVDGISATSLLLTYFTTQGAAARVYIPHRVTEGYGLNQAALEELGRSGVTLLVTSDCGTTSHREVAAARALGIDVIVTDHHQLDGEPPAVLAALNPQRADSRYPFAGLCSGGLAYKLAQAYEVKYGAGKSSLAEALDLVALATVADVVPLQDENRWLTRMGLSLITEGRRCGLRALKQQAGIERACTARTVAYKLAPRINAAGRLAHAAMAVRLLTTASVEEAGRIAADLERLNRDRQRLEEETCTEAAALLDGGELPPGLVVSARHWHLGVVGIVAARLVETFDRPAVVLAVDERSIAKGSARSVAGFDLHEALSQCRELLLGFGGHPSAAGLTLRAAAIPAFSRRFAEVTADRLGGEPRRPDLRVDAEVSLKDVTHRLVHELEQLQPFGAGNPEPTLAVRNLSVLETRVVGANHLRLTVRQKGSAPFVGIGFRMGALAERSAAARAALDLAFVPELDHWRGLDRVQLRIRDVRSSRPLE